MPGAFGQNGGSIKLVNGAYVLELGRGPDEETLRPTPGWAQARVCPRPAGPSPGIRTCLVPVVSPPSYPNGYQQVVTEHSDKVSYKRVIFGGTRRPTAGK